MIAGFVRGLSVRDVEATLVEALGEGAAVSKSTVSRVCEEIQAQFEAWSARRLDDVELDYLFLDGSHFGTVNLRSCGRSANHISLIRHTRPGESRRRTGENRPRIAQVDSARSTINGLYLAAINVDDSGTLEGNWYTRPSATAPKMICHSAIMPIGPRS